MDSDGTVSTPSFVRVVVQKFKYVTHLQTEGSSHKPMSFINIKNRY